VTFNRRPGARSNRGRIATAGASAPFDPSQIPGLVVHLDAALGITIGTGVSAWADQTSNANHFTNAVGATQPNYTASDANLNGQPAVVCDVVDNVLVCANNVTIAWVAFVGHYPGAVFSAFNCAFAQTVTQYFRGTAASADWRTADILANRWRDGVSTATALDVANNAHLWEIEPTAGPTAHTGWRIGRDPGGAGRQWLGNIGLLLAASTMPSAGTRAQLLTYCQTRFGV
jgi:hypothetical protein